MGTDGIGVRPLHVPWPSWNNNEFFHKSTPIFSPIFQSQMGTDRIGVRPLHVLPFLNYVFQVVFPFLLFFFSSSVRPSFTSKLLHFHTFICKFYLPKFTLSHFHIKYASMPFYLPKRRGFCFEIN